MDIRIEWHYKTKKGTEATFSSDEMPVAKALLIAEDIERTGRLKHISFVDRYDTTWSLKELKKFMEEIKTEAYNITVYFDGGFDLETNDAGLGCAIYYEQNDKNFRIRKNALVTGLENNNEAEYAALDLGLKELEFLGVHHLPVLFIGDSKVVINHLNDEWPSYDEELSKWADRIEASFNRLGVEPLYKLISRKGNQEADQLATQALKGIEIMSSIEIEE